jgi:hypothetical protein
MQMNTLAEMTRAMNAATLSPLTGAPMAAAVNTGDSADQHSTLELDWYIGVLDGGSFTPNSGKAGEYEGVQVWDNTWAWHPEDPSNDDFGAYGFPTIPGLLNAAVSQTVTSPGLSVPWYAVFGNHDSCCTDSRQSIPACAHWQLATARRTTGKCWPRSTCEEWAKMAAFSIA